MKKSCDILIEGGSLHTSVQGEGAPLLMIHGIISDGSFFEGAARILAEEYQVITYDRRGYGKSLGTFQDFSVGIQAGDARTILEECCKEPAWVLGNSAGGLIGLELALRYPWLVRGMILVEPSLGYAPEEQEKLRAWNRELNGYLDSGKIKQALPAFARVIGGGENSGKSSSLREMKQTYQNLSNFMYGELNEVQHYLPPSETLAALRVPVAVAVTEQGKEGIFATSSLDGARRLGWPVLKLPGFHNVAKEQPEEFAGRIAAAFKNGFGC